MTLNIVRSTDPVSIETLVVLIYGDPGAGKTSLGFTADSPLMLDFDRGAYRSGFRGDSVPVDSWADVQAMEAGDFAHYRTVVVDTVGRALDLMAEDIMRSNPKMRGPMGGLTLQGYGALKSGFAAWMKLIRSFGRDVVLIAHGKEDKSGDDLIMRPDVVGSSYGEVFKIADAVGWLVVEAGNKRMLHFDPAERFVGKNPAALAPVEVPHFAKAPHYLGGLLTEIKSAIGSISEEARLIVATVQEWSAAVAGAEAPEDLTALVVRVNEEVSGPATYQVKALIRQRSQTLGYTWDAQAKAFTVAKEDAA